MCKVCKWNYCDTVFSFLGSYTIRQSNYTLGKYSDCTWLPRRSQNTFEGCTLGTSLFTYKTTALNGTRSSRTVSPCQRCVSVAILERREMLARKSHVLDSSSSMTVESR